MEDTLLYFVYNHIFEENLVKTSVNKWNGGLSLNTKVKYRSDINGQQVIIWIIEIQCDS